MASANWPLASLLRSTPLSAAWDWRRQLTRPEVRSRRRNVAQSVLPSTGQGLLGDRAKDGSNAAFEMEMDRGRTDSQRLGEPAQAEPICADALDQLGGGGEQ